MLNIDSDLYGANKVFFQVARTLRNDGHDVLIFIPSEGSLTDLFKQNNLEYRLLNLGVLRRKYLNPFGLLNRAFKLTNAYRLLKKAAEEWKADTIYSNTLLIWVGLIVARRLRLNHFWHLHEILEPSLPKRIFGYLLSKNNGHFISVSRAVENCWEQYFNANSRHHLLYNGVEKPYADSPDLLRQELSLRPDTVLVGLIGRINHWKGQEYFIEIAAEVNKKHSNVAFVIVGDPYPGNDHLVEKLKFQIDLLRLTNVFMLGFRRDIGNVLSSLDVFMSASVKDDPFPLVILEAMSSGLPIVATKQGGAIEMLEEGISGIFIPIHEPKIAADRIDKLILSEEMRKEMGQQAGLRVTIKFSESSFINKIKVIFK